MKRNKLKILSLALVAVLIQGTCVYAAGDKTYTKDELENLTPGFEAKDIDKSNYKVSSDKNNFSSTQQSTDTTEDTTSTTTTTTVTTATDSAPGNEIVSTTPSTGRKGDFWGKTKDGKWILIEQGVPVSGWKNIKGKWYYMDADGVMQTGWINNGEKWYFLQSDGIMAYNTYIGGYYLGWDGAWVE